MVINGIIINATLEEILITLTQQLASNGISLFHVFRDSGNNIMTCCPYHKGGQERKPSAGFLKSDGTFHCFACGETHSLQEVISHCWGKDDYGAYGWNWLVKNFVQIEVEERKTIELDIDRNSGSTIRSLGNTNYVTEEELESYRYIHPYMYKRKLNDDIINLFDIGYDDKTKCITFPIRDMQGNCLFVARRSVETKYFNYPSGAEKPLYGLYELYKDPLYMPSEVIVCESMLDALACWVYGKKAVAMNGLGSELQYKQLREMPCRKLILATDNDEAGMEARKKIRKEVKNKIITEYILPEGRKDINDLSKEEFDNLKEVF